MWRKRNCLTRAATAGGREQACSQVPRLEWLEDRLAPSGDVSVYLSGNTLMLYGDAADNDVLVKEGKQEGSIQISGIHTTLNGSQRTLTYTGITQVYAYLGDGKDRFQSRDLTLTSMTLHGEGGDDWIDVARTTFVGGFTGLRIYGDYLFRVQDGTAGNDTIEVTETTFDGQGSFYATSYLDIYGDYSYASTVTGGNDTIRVANTTISATAATYTNSSYLRIYGDYSYAAIVSGGNDSIWVGNTTIHAQGGDRTSNTGTAGAVLIYGDYSYASTVTGGNDTIEVWNTSFLAEMGASSSSQTVEIYGDYNSSSTVTGGNDTIRVRNSSVAALGEGSGSNTAALKVYGEYNTSTSKVTGGDDTIELVNISILAEGGRSARATLDVYGDYGGTVAGGHDTIRARGVDVQAVDASLSTLAFFNVYGDLASAMPEGGDDLIAVRHSSLIASGGSTSMALLGIQADSGPGGADTVELKDVVVAGGTLDSISLSTGEGDDSVTLKQVVSDAAFVSLGGGDNTLVLRSNRIQNLQL